ncbi:MAG: hypothetical protein BWK80_20955 [Desulfobacteraceae bacterium IS3]|nr:MAG: hypothetical protein BWK80_20955 [Desulfobacteraceae bacterium IS3]
MSRRDDRKQPGPGLKIDIAGKRNPQINPSPAGTTENSPPIYRRVAGSVPVFKSRRDDRKQP